jgi:cAMP-dependent protein kinase regulator
MFINLEEQNLKEVIDVMDYHKANPQYLIIKEGEPGEVLYIIESGKMTCSKIINGESKIFKKYCEGDVFGELTFLYNAPRAATIQADTEYFLKVSDRQTFNHIVKDASQNKRAKYEKFLSTVPILQNMDHYERSKLADAVKEKRYAKNE